LADWFGESLRREDFAMPDYAREFTDLCRRITETERRVEAQHDRIAGRPGGSEDVLYAQVLAGVLERSLALMYRRRDRIERELCAFRRSQELRRPAVPDGLASRGAAAVGLPRRRAEARFRGDDAWEARRRSQSLRQAP
jgi:hypothetical protein